MPDRIEAHYSGAPRHNPRGLPSAARSATLFSELEAPGEIDTELLDLAEPRSPPS